MVGSFMDSKMAKSSYGSPDHSPFSKAWYWSSPRMSPVLSLIIESWMG